MSRHTIFAARRVVPPLLAKLGIRSEVLSQEIEREIARLPKVTGFAQQHMGKPLNEVLERAFAAGFQPVAIPPYESALCVRRGECAAVLTTISGGGLRLLAPPTLLIDGHLSVKLKRGQGEVFVWKKKELTATAERLEELAKFREELSTLLDGLPLQ